MALQNFNAIFIWIYIATLHSVYGFETYSTVACNGDEFNETLCVNGTQVLIVGAYYYISAHDESRNKCDYNREDCFTDITTSEPEVYDFIVSRCNRRQACDGVVAGTNSSVFGSCLRRRNVRDDYTMLQYQCVKDYAWGAFEETTHTPKTNTAPNTEPSQKEGDVQKIVACGMNSARIQCADGFINILHVYYSEVSYGLCSNTTYINDNDCKIPMSSNEFTDLLNACNGQRECQAGRPKTLYRHCQHSKLTVYETVVEYHFMCDPSIRSAIVCNYESLESIEFDQSDSKVIQFRSIKFGSLTSLNGDGRDRTLQTCRTDLRNNNTKTCFADVKSIHQTYYDDILKTCEGRNKCGSITAHPATIPKCEVVDTQGHLDTDFIKVEYVCLTLDYMNSAAPSSDLDSIINISMALVYSLGAAGLLLVILITSLVTCLCKARRRIRALVTTTIQAHDASAPGLTGLSDQNRTSYWKIADSYMTAPGGKYEQTSFMNP